MAIVTLEFNSHTHQHVPTATKYRIGISLAQYRILLALVGTEKVGAIHPIEYDLELNHLYLSLARMVKNIAGDLKRPDSSYVALADRKRASHQDVSVAGLGLSEESRIADMSESEAEVFWAAQEAGMMQGLEEKIPTVE